MMLLLAALVTIGAPAQGCSIFMASVGGRVLFGSNVDDGNPNTYYEIVPASREGEYGFVTLGFARPQGGLNEAGLAFYTNAVPSRPLKPRSEFPPHPEGPVGIATEMLGKAATVEGQSSLAPVRLGR